MRDHISYRLVLILLFLLTVAFNGFCLEPGPDDKYTIVEGVKWPNSAEEGTEPVVTKHRALNISRITRNQSAYNELLPHLLASPDQTEAGSCLYMSLTGNAEWWLSRLNPAVSTAADGPIDLSERYLMNLSGGTDEANSPVQNWKLDSIFLFNIENKSVLNTGYRYTKGWYKHDSDDKLLAALPDEEGASYGTYYNWIIGDLAAIKPADFVELPHFKRDVIFEDPESNQWNVGVTPDNIVEKIKTALTVNKAPVQIIYNHFGYWHAVMIVGYDDNADNDDCSFVKRSIKHNKDKAVEYFRKIFQTTDPEKQEYYYKRYKKYMTTYTKLKHAVEDGGYGKKGVFYVRDSIYSDSTAPLYDYDLSREGEEEHYCKKVIVHEYEWAKYLGNHIIQIMPE